MRSKENLIEDYPPWSYVAEMRQGYVELVATSHDGTYEVEWIPAAEAAGVRAELGIRLSDF